MDFLGVEYLHLRTKDGGDLYLTVSAAVLAQHPAGELVCERLVQEQAPAAGGDQHGVPVPTRRWTASAGPGGEVLAGGRGHADGHLHHQQVRQCRVQQSVRGVLVVDGVAQGRARAAGDPDPDPAAVGDLRAAEAVAAVADRAVGAQDQRQDRQHPGVEIDILRQYVVLFGWVKGLDAVETADFFELRRGPQAVRLPCQQPGRSTSWRRRATG